VNERYQRADHVAYCVALGDDEAVEFADGAESVVEVASLGYGVCSDEGLGGVLVMEGIGLSWGWLSYLADHEDLVRLGEVGELL
jgi:hypothetical protein